MDQTSPLAFSSSNENKLGPSTRKKTEASETATDHPPFLISQCRALPHHDFFEGHGRLRWTRTLR